MGVLCMHGYLYVHYLYNIASKIRGAVAGIPFESFHKYSSEIIRAGVFGRDEHGKIRDRLVFSANNLVSQYVTRFTRITPTTRPKSLCNPLQTAPLPRLSLTTQCMCSLHYMLMCTQWLIMTALRSGCSHLFTHPVLSVCTHMYYSVYIVYIDLTVSSCPLEIF